MLCYSPSSLSPDFPALLSSVQSSLASPSWSNSVLKKQASNDGFSIEQISGHPKPRSSHGFWLGVLGRLAYLCVDDTTRKEQLHPSEFDGVIGNTERNKCVFLPKMHPFSLVLFYLLCQDSICMIISISMDIWYICIYNVCACQMECPQWCHLYYNY